MAVPFLDLKKQYAEIGERVQARMQKVFGHGMFVNGPEVKESEQKLAEFVGCKEAIVCSNGTTALQLALMEAGVGPGDEVIVPTFSFIATAEVVHLVGATPVYVDIELDTYNLNLDQLDEALSAKTKAVMPVSLYGQTCDLVRLEKWAQQNNVFLIEDGAQSFGALHSDRRSGSFGDMGCTSFFPAKPLGVYGDGGAVFTNDSERGERLRLLRSHGEPTRYSHSLIGTNARLNTLQCAILLEKLERYPWEIEQRNRIAETYTMAFEKIENVKTPLVIDGNQSVWAQYTLAVQNRDAVRDQLQELGIPTAIHYPKPMCDQPAYEGKGRVVQNEKARQASSQVFSLPLYADMPTSDVKQVIEAVQKVLG